MYMWPGGRDILVCQEYCFMWLQKIETSKETAEQLVLNLLQFHMNFLESSLREIENIERLNNQVPQRKFMLI
jgi:hypothetical protein